MRVISPAFTAAISGASDIETLHKSRFVHLHLTLLPQVTGRRHKRRLASPLHGTLTPGRISVGRPLSGSWTGVSLSLTESLQYSLPSAAFRTDGNRWAPYILAALIEAFGKGIPPFFLPAPTGGLGASSDVACLFCQEAPSVTYLCLRIFDFRGAGNY